MVREGLLSRDVIGSNRPLADIAAVEFHISMLQPLNAFGGRAAVAVAVLLWSNVLGRVSLLPSARQCLSES
jgi:hypothetical protein